MKEPVPLSERFWRRVSKMDGCWLWMGATDGRGYGSIRAGVRGTRLLKAHRVSWELHTGPIPRGLIVCHSCDTPGCVRPEHLFLGTMADNSADMVKKQRHARTIAARKLRRGILHPMVKLTEQHVLAIRQRRMDGEKLRVIAADFCVSTATIHAIVSRRLWSHI